jgi:hypothetical protein
MPLEVDVENPRWGGLHSKNNCRLIKPASIASNKFFSHFTTVYSLIRGLIPLVSPEGDGNYGITEWCCCNKTYGIVRGEKFTATLTSPKRMKNYNGDLDGSISLGLFMSEGTVLPDLYDGKASLRYVRELPKKNPGLLTRNSPVEVQYTYQTRQYIKHEIAVVSRSLLKAKGGKAYLVSEEQVRARIDALQRLYPYLPFIFLTGVDRLLALLTSGLCNDTGMMHVTEVSYILTVLLNDMLSKNPKWLELARSTKWSTVSIPTEMLYGIDPEEYQHTHFPSETFKLIRPDLEFKKPKPNQVFIKALIEGFKEYAEIHGLPKESDKSYKKYWFPLDPEICPKNPGALYRPDKNGIMKIY